MALRQVPNAIRARAGKQPRLLPKKADRAAVWSEPSDSPRFPWPPWKKSARGVGGGIKW